VLLFSLLLFDVLLDPPNAPPRLSPIEFPPRHPDKHRVRRLPAAQSCRAQHPFDSPTEAFRQRDREPVPRRHERLDPDQRRIGFECGERHALQHHRRHPEETPAQQNMSCGHNGRSWLDYDYSVENAVFA
jgi:hypothetical protein